MKSIYNERGHLIEPPQEKYVLKIKMKYLTAVAHFGLKMQKLAAIIKE